MDAFSVSLADGLSEQGMKSSKKLAIAGTFAVFQFAMPMIGWILVKTAVEKFSALEIFIPWTALVLLLYIGIEMLIEGIKEKKKDAGDSQEEADKHEVLTFGTLMLQGLATSIDALSVGLTIESYDAATAFVSSLIIGVVTFAICIAGIEIGRKIGTVLSGRASMLGGVILIAIGIEIWAKGVFF